MKSRALIGGSRQRWAGEMGHRAGSHRAEAGTRGREAPFWANPEPLLPPPGSVPSKQAGPEVDPEVAAPGSHLKTSLLLTPGTGARTGHDLVWGRGRKRVKSPLSQKAVGEAPWGMHLGAPALCSL